MFELRAPHAAPPGYAARIREELKPLIGIYPAGYGLVGTDNAPLTVGTGITLVPGRDGMVLDTTSTNTGLTRACAVTDHPLTLVFGGRCNDSSGPSVYASLATTADKLVRVYNHVGAIYAQHLGATTHALASTGSVVADGYFVSGVAVFAGPTDVRIYARGSAGQSRAATTTNVGALGALNKASFGVYDGSVKLYPFNGQIQYAQWLRVALTDAEAWALVDNPWGMFEPRRIWVPVSAGGGGSHDATGAMSAQSATVSGSAAAVATYTSSGALTAQAATVAGTANHVTTHASSGVLEAQAATVAGSATHVAVHGSTGVLEAQAATVSGSADHSAAGAFSATGALTAQAAAVAGSAAHLTLHTATGALASGSATAAGAAVHYTLHTATGDLGADAASISGSALHEGDGAEVAKPFTGAGRPRRTRQRVVVEIDGEDFIAESVEEARALLDKAKDAAEEKASIAVKRATEAKKRPARKIVADARKSLALPTINAPGLEDYAGQIAQQIEDLYRSTIRTIEVESLLHNRDRAEEDDEDILLLIA